MGFLWLVAVLVDLNFTTKALSAYVIFGEGIVNDTKVLLIYLF
jgi:hypothetical protein